MHYLDKSFNLARRAPRHAALAMTLAVCIAMGSAHAQVLVTDVPAETATGTTATASTAMQAFQAGAQYTNFVAQLTQLTSTISSIASNPLGAIIPNTSTMTQLSSTQIQSLITAKCLPTSSGGNIVTSALQSAVQGMNLNNSIQQQQQQICANVINAQADQYNATVLLYQQIPALQNNFAALQGLVQQLNGVMGNSTSATAQTVTFTAQQQTQIAAWQTRMGMDTQIVTALNQQQSTLAAVALNARPDLLGSAVQATALATAFSLNQ